MTEPSEIEALIEEAKDEIEIGLPIAVETVLWLIAALEEARATVERQRAMLENSREFGDAVKLACDERLTEQKHEIRRLQAKLAEEPSEAEKIKNRLDLRLNDYLVEMKPNYDDSITGFNEAWSIMTKTFDEALAARKVGTKS